MSNNEKVVPEKIAAATNDMADTTSIEEALAKAGEKQLPRVSWRIKDKFGESVIYDCTMIQLNAKGLTVIDGQTILAHYNEWSNHIRVTG